MTKNEFAKVVARRYHMTNDTTKAWVEAIFGTLGEILASGEEVNLRGFGVFRQRQTRPKVGRNGRTSMARRSWRNLTARRTAPPPCSITAT